MNGAYVLLVRVSKNCKLKIGKLGELNFDKGYYAYVGSALGRCKLEKRVERHLRKKKKKRWHIDYLLSSNFCKVDAVFLFPSKEKIECKISRFLEKRADRTIKKFGSSDCKCKGHLHYFRKLGNLVESLEDV